MFIALLHSNQSIKHSNQSINQSTKQPTSQPANQPTNQSTNQPTNLSINQSMNQSINHSINQSINQPTNQSIKPVCGEHLLRRMCTLWIMASRSICRKLLRSASSNSRPVEGVFVRFSAIVLLYLQLLLDTLAMYLLKAYIIAQLTAQGHLRAFQKFKYRRS